MIDKLDFGDYVTIEQYRYGADNENYLHKVIGLLKSNNYVEVPVKSTPRETLHKKIVHVIACICCGVDERTVFRYRITDVKYVKKRESE